MLTIEGVQQRHRESCDLSNQLPRCALQMRTNLIQHRHADRGASQRCRWPAGNGAAPDRRAAWHTPLHRQAHIMALQGLPVVALLALDLFARIIAMRIDAGPPFSALFTLWLSMMAALGLASRSACSRHAT